MPERSGKPTDINRRSAAFVAQSAGDEPEADPHEGKNRAAVELGRLGGQKGGKARAAKLTQQQRSDIARRTANARWGVRPSDAGATE